MSHELEEDQSQTPSSLILEIPAMFIIASVSPAKEGEGYDVTLTTTMTKTDAASLIHVSRRHSIIGKLILTEGNLEAEQ